MVMLKTKSSLRKKFSIGGMMNTPESKKPPKGGFPVCTQKLKRG
jgi:hypothetical protein